MVFKATFNNISVISWRSVLLVEEPGGPEENHRSVAHILNVVHLALIEIRTHNISGDPNEPKLCRKHIYEKYSIKFANFVRIR
jgi:hypothetical protein